MIADRYYYHQLNKSEQVIYKAIYSGVKAHQDLIHLPVKGKLPEKSLDKVYAAVTNDNPLIYYLNQSMYSYATDQFGHMALCPQYFWDSEKVREYNRKIEKCLSGIIGQLQLQSDSDYEKEQKIHDWMCRNVTYDFDGSDMNNPLRVIESHNVIGVFARRKAQCEGIAKAVKVLLNALDMKCILATGNAKDKGNIVPHVWNIVKIGGTPYHLDVTWDIGHCGRGKRCMPYDYFNISDALIRKTHFSEFVFPECNSLQENYFNRNRIVFKTKRGLWHYIDDQLKHNVFEFYFRIEGRVRVSEVISDLLEHITELIYQKGIQGSSIQQMIDEEINTCWIKIG